MALFFFLVSQWRPPHWLGFDGSFYFVRVSLSNFIGDAKCHTHTKKSLNNLDARALFIGKREQFLCRSCFSIKFYWGRKLNILVRALYSLLIESSNKIIFQGSFCAGSAIWNPPKLCMRLTRLHLVCWKQTSALRDFVCSSCGVLKESACGEGAAD